MPDHQSPQPAPKKNPQFENPDKMPGLQPPAMQLQADPTAAPVQLKGEKVGPLGIVCQGEGTIEGEGVSVSKNIGSASIGTIANGTEVHVLPDNGLGKGKKLFIYGKFDYVQGGSGMEYVWVEKDAVKMNAPEKKEAKPAPKSPAAGDPSTETKETWRSSGNLRGHPPVRSQDPHNINVVEDEATYKDLLKLAQTSLKSIKAKAAGMKNDDGIIDHKYWFTKVYQYVTEGELDYIESGQYYYPSYVLRSVIYFEQVYRDNVEAAETKAVEAHWKKAFEKTSEKGTDLWVDYLDAIQCLVKSMLAHIRFDLPRCEAWVFNSYYSSMKGVKIEDFQQDFMSMGGIFDKAGLRMTQEIFDFASWYWGKWQMGLTPAMGEQIAMSYYFDADMGPERADAWKRAEMLVNDGKAGPDPYKISGSTISGNVTSADHQSGIGKLDQGMAPKMDDAAELVDDNSARKQLSTATDQEIQKWSVGKRTRMLIGMLVGGTFNDDENAIVRLLQASSDALVTIVDGANAWTLINAVDGSQYTQVRALLKDKYYGKTGVATCSSLISKCCAGETANWEEAMIADIVEANGSDRLVPMIERANARVVLDNLDGSEYTSVKGKFRSSYYPQMPQDSALGMILTFLNETETSEFEEVMIMDILETRADARTIVRKIGQSIKGKAATEDADFNNGLNELEWTLDGDEDTRLSNLLGDSK